MQTQISVEAPLTVKNGISEALVQCLKSHLIQESELEALLVK